MGWTKQDIENLLGIWDKTGYIIKTDDTVRNIAGLKENKLAYKKFQSEYPDLCKTCSEFIYFIQHCSEPDFVESLFCRCGNRNPFKWLSVGYAGFCSRKCSSMATRSKASDTMMKRYGAKSVLSEGSTIRQKVMDTNLDRYGSEFPFQSAEVQEKCRRSHFEEPDFHKTAMLAKYGVENASHLEAVCEKRKSTNKRKYDCTCVLSNADVRSKGRQTQIDRYGDLWCRSELGKSVLSENATKQMEDQKERNRNLFGVDYFVQTEDFRTKHDETKKQNQSFNTSKPEELSYRMLCDWAGTENVVRQYHDDRYRYRCDFYLPVADLFIECNYHWTHGGEAYIGTDEQNLKRDAWLAIDTPFYTKAVDVWVNRDVEKRQCAKNQCLNWLEFFDFRSFSEWLKTQKDINYYKSLELSFDDEDLYREYVNIQMAEPSYSSSPRYANIVLRFQPQFYDRERQWLGDADNLSKLFRNRWRYLGKRFGELTSRELLRGVKISKLATNEFQPYSHFSHGWFAKFIEEYKPNAVYDPCGGWGHRLTACSKDFNYIYNDINTQTVKGCQDISTFLGMTNKVFYNQDASIFTPKEYYDAVFTCPPYWNLEIYSDTGAENLDREDFMAWWDQVLWSALKPDVRTVGFVIHYHLMESMTAFFNNTEWKLDKKLFVGNSVRIGSKARISNREMLIVYTRQV